MPHYIARDATPEEIAAAQMDLDSWADAATWSRARRAAELDRLDLEAERGPISRLWYEVMRSSEGRRLVTQAQLRDAPLALPYLSLIQDDVDEADDDVAEEDDTIRPEPSFVQCLLYMLTLDRRDPIARRRIRLLREALAVGRGR